MSTQTEMFREFPPSGSEASGGDPAFEGLPVDIQDAIGVISRGAFGAPDSGRPVGANSFDAGALSPLGVPQSPAAGGGQNGQPNFQQRFIHSMSPVKTRATVDVAGVHVLDLATPEGAAEYERLMKEVYPRALAENSLGGAVSWNWKVTPYPPMADPHALRGFRAVTMIEYVRTEVKKGHDSSELEFGVVDHQGKVKSAPPAAKAS